MVIKSLWKLFITLSNVDCMKAVPSESAKCYGLDLLSIVAKLSHDFLVMERAK